MRDRWSLRLLSNLSLIRKSMISHSRGCSVKKEGQSAARGGKKEADREESRTRRAEGRASAKGFSAPRRRGRVSERGGGGGADRGLSVMRIN